MVLKGLLHASSVLMAGDSTVNKAKSLHSGGRRQAEKTLDNGMWGKYMKKNKSRETCTERWGAFLIMCLRRAALGKGELYARQLPLWGQRWVFRGTAISRAGGIHGCRGHTGAVRCQDLTSGRCVDRSTALKEQGVTSEVCETFRKLPVTPKLSFLICKKGIRLSTHVVSVAKKC